MRLISSSCFLLMIAGSVLFSACNRSPALDRPEAEKALKILDSDVTRWLDHINQSDAGQALKALLAFDSAPFPVRFPRSFMKVTRTIYCPENFAGTWSWDQSLGKFSHSPGGENIIIEYPLPGHTGNDATCIIYKYKEEPTTSANFFPTLLEADIFVKGEKVFSILHHAKTEHDLPVFLQTDITMGEGFMKVFMENKLDTQNQMGAVTSTIKAGTTGNHVIDGTIQAIVKAFSGGTYGIRKFHSEIRIFDCLVNMDIDYGRIDPTSKEYVNEFNRHSKIHLFTAASRQKIGDIILKEKFDRKKLDFSIRFTDLSDDFLSNYLLVFKRILDVKTSK